MRSMDKKYRANVAAIIRDRRGLLLLGQRSDYPDSWQFPQGGVDKGETAEDAVRREVLEETGIHPADYEITSRRGPYRYDFPHGVDRRGHHGQEQTYFLCELLGPDAPRFDPASTCGEFLAVRWVPVPGFPVHLAPPMKQEVYRRVLRDFFPAGDDSH